MPLVADAHVEVVRGEQHADVLHSLANAKQCGLVVQSLVLNQGVGIAVAAFLGVVMKQHAFLWQQFDNCSPKSLYVGL